MKAVAIGQINAALIYSKEEVVFSQVVAEDEIKDPELLKRLGEINNSIKSTLDYLASKTDSKIG